MTENKDFPWYPLLPLRGLSVFPGMLLNFDVMRPVSISALNNANAGDKLVVVVAQKNLHSDRPSADDLYEVGTICRIRQTLKVPGTDIMRVMVEGLKRARLIEYEPFLHRSEGQVEPLEDVPLKADNARVEAMVRQCVEAFEKYSQVAPNLPPEMFANIISSTDPVFIADYIAQNIFLRHEKKQELLEERRPLTRLKLLTRFLKHEIDVLHIEQSLSERTQELMERNQKEFYLREQMKAIQEELGEGEDLDELNEYRAKILSLNLADEITEKLLKELARLSKQPNSAESAVLRTYLDTCIELPWHRRTKETVDITKAKRILDEEHFGLTKVKERIIENIAVRQLTPKLKGSVLCFVGPPGTGKTSIAMSIAHAMNRRVARLSLGGVHDEAEIRGHRKTYVGAMPGRIISAVIQARSENAILVLDEIDKLGHDYRGDPASALLEALDSEQNFAFRDHYLEIPYDLSETIFITTANTTDTIPRALLDRMEVIELSSYTDEEKLQIAKNHLLPKQRKKHGLSAKQLKLSDDAIRELISSYTREAGVRLLERQLASLCRKTARKIAEGQYKSLNLRAGNLEPILGPVKYKPDKLRPADEVGLVRGLAWTPSGGEVLDVEVSVLEGTGKLELTGNLGDVMKESAKAAVSYIRSRAQLLGIDREFYKNRDIHIHFPEGAVPKDGPSAGLAICIAVISALTGIPVRRDIAMTGEISLRGRVMPIGGLKEKTMAAHRSGITTVIIPADNNTDLTEIDGVVRAALDFVTTDHVDKVLSVALNRPIEAQETVSREIMLPPLGHAAAPVLRV
jgi:ATP-dependent Lon protease